MANAIKGRFSAVTASAQVADVGLFLICQNLSWWQMLVLPVRIKSTWFKLQLEWQNLRYTRWEHCSGRKEIHTGLHRLNEETATEKLEWNVWFSETASGAGRWFPEEWDHQSERGKCSVTLTCQPILLLLLMISVVHNFSFVILATNAAFCQCRLHYVYFSTKVRPGLRWL